MFTACPCRRWLLGLLVLQSSSSFVLDRYSELLREHLVVTLFLTMLVGAGGNAGNQSAIKVIRGLVRRRRLVSSAIPVCKGRHMKDRHETFRYSAGAAADSAGHET